MSGNVSFKGRTWWRDAEWWKGPAPTIMKVALALFIIADIIILVSVSAIWVSHQPWAQEQILISCAPHEHITVTVNGVVVCR